MDGYNYVPDGAHRHRELEKVQKEILQQHKYIESQINALRTNMKAYCGTPMCNTINDVTRNVDFATYELTPHQRKPYNHNGVYTNTTTAVVPSAAAAVVPLYQYENRNPYNYKQFNTNYYKRPSQYVYNK
ncbi:ORF106 [Betabaculovirus altermyunipunctae]|uniref:ORF106 n=1 Tax=Betabaculovirus altermyunipunctae TaxID=3051996 RepID=A0A1S5YE06_9BBAC|nr:ORF106 [Betabaculovirus altermyunipunctae]AQQ80373.1 ORF106 [Betabaculovirus altermyunipunctae]